MKRMKQIASLLLIVALALSLTVPALAYEDTDPPQWEQWGFSSLEECVEYLYGGDTAAYYEEIAYTVEFEKWKAEHAGLAASFDADAYWSENYWGGDYGQSKEDFMLMMGFTEEDFRDYLLEDYLYGLWWAEQEAQAVVEEKQALGGVPGEIGVMLNGEYLSFDAQPELRDGRTMVPCRQVMEALGASVGYEDGKAVCRLTDGTVTVGGETLQGDITLRFQAGEQTVAVECGGTEKTMELDVPCYYKNGRTYIPVRFFAQALGCDVFYDARFETAVLLNRQEIIHDIDASFSVVNQVVDAMATEAGQNYKTVASFGADLTMLDSINGDKTYSMDASAEMVQSGSAFSVTGRVNMGELMEVEQIQEIFDGMSAVELGIVRSALSNLKYKLIYDGTEGVAYLNLPTLALIPGSGLGEEDWIAIPAGAVGTEQEIGSVGDLIYRSVTGLNGAGEGGVAYDAVYFYSDIATAADEVSALVGDKCFAAEGGYHVYRYDMEDYEAYLEELYGEEAEYYNEMDKLSADLRVARSGAVTFRMEMQSRDQGFYTPVMFFSADGKLSSAGVSVNTVLKIKNTLDLKIRYTASTTPTTQSPDRLPEGAVVIDPYGIPVTPEEGTTL